MQGVVSVVAQHDGFSILLVKQAIAFGAPSLDVTNEVVRMYNDKYKVPATPASTSPKKPDAPKK
jgi:hypothetical protein